MKVTALAAHTPEAVRAVLAARGWESQPAWFAATGIEPLVVLIEDITETEREALVHWATKSGADVLTGDGWAFVAGGASRLAPPATRAHPSPVSTSAPDLVAQWTSASRSVSVMSSISTTSGSMPVAANQAGWDSQPRAASTARTASGVCAASAVTFMRRLPQRLHDAQPGRPPRGEEAADQSHHDGEEEAVEQQ